MSAFPGSESEIATWAERLREAMQGRYELPGRHIAGDGYVEFDGMQLAIERRVTIRVVRGPPSHSLLSSERVRALVRLSHPHILPVLELFEIGELLVAVTPTADDKGSWWTTRSLDGVSSNDPERWIKTVMRAIRETAAALAFAHGKGIVHGGFRPECIRFSEDGSVCLGGFLTGETSGEWSPFVSPELNGGAQATAAADQYALGVLSYLLIAGVLPFTDMEGQRRGASRTALAGLASVPVNAILRMMAYAADDRFASMDEVLLALADANEGRPEEDETVGALDENVQFTVYRPSVVKPAQWYPMLAFAHLSEAREGSIEPDPVAIVERQAKQVLDDAIGEYKQIVEDASQPIPREGTITFVPEMAGVEFNPPRQSIEWVESVHRVEFRLRAAPSLDGKTARGRLTVYHGVIILAELTLSIKVDQRHEAQPMSAEAPVTARPYRKIFASYSHKDVDIVRQFETFAATLGDSYLRDSRDIRSGEVWTERLQELMREADVVQLFWSWNAMASPFVRQEWEYALSLGRPNFVRPTYWEDPMPATPDGSLPTPELLRLQFQRIASSRTEFKQKFGHSGYTGEFPSPSVSTAHPMPASAAPPARAARAEPAAPAAPASATPRPAPSARHRWRMASRVSTTVAALGFVGVALFTTRTWTSTSAPPISMGSAPPPVVGSSPDTVASGSGGDGGGRGGPPPLVVGRDTIRYSTAPPPPPPTKSAVEVPVTTSVSEVAEAYRMDSTSAQARFDGKQVVVDLADSAKVTFARRNEEALMRIDSRPLVCRIDGTRSGRLVVRDCHRARPRP